MAGLAVDMPLIPVVQQYNESPMQPILQLQVYAAHLVRLDMVWAQQVIQLMAGLAVVIKQVWDGLQQ
jgi:hypothetical protein